MGEKKDIVMDTVTWKVVQARARRSCAAFSQNARSVSG